MAPLLGYALRPYLLLENKKPSLLSTNREGFLLCARVTSSAATACLCLPCRRCSDGPKHDHVEDALASIILSEGAQVIVSGEVSIELLKDMRGALSILIDNGLNKLSMQS